ncbi:MAG: xanthine dehydrogenase subunit D, partial [Deltaproteobacteria bacterium]|nr:xanthine dehydrogenase subunit D [Deltaproteobacteria bacterium]
MSAVGQTLPMIDAEERVTGRITYALNVERPGMVHGKVLRSPYPHARIRSIDAAAAERLAGVAAVLSQQDFTEASGYSANYGRIFRDQSVVALDKVRFIGDPVAAVAAVSEDIAEEALSLIKVDYEELPAVYDELAALDSAAPLLHDPRPAQQAIFSNLIQDLP